MMAKNKNGGMKLICDLFQDNQFREHKSARSVESFQVRFLNKIMYDQVKVNVV